MALGEILQGIKRSLAHDMLFSIAGQEVALLSTITHKELYLQLVSCGNIDPKESKINL